MAWVCDLIAIALDVLKPLGHEKITEYKLGRFRIHLNSKPLNIGFKKEVRKASISLSLALKVSWMLKLCGTFRLNIKLVMPVWL